MRWGRKAYKAMGGVLPGSIVGFDKAGEAVTAKYADKGTLTLLLYPTPQIAGDHLRQIEEEQHKPNVAQGTVLLRREGPLVLMTSGAWTGADAKAMIEGIHLRSEITFDRKMPPEFHAEVQKTYSLLTSIAIFCGWVLWRLCAGALSRRSARGDSRPAGKTRGDGAGVSSDRSRADPPAPIHSDGPGLSS